MNKAIVIRAYVLEDSGVKSVVIDGKSIDFRSILVRYDNRVIKLKCTLDIEASVFVDQEVDIYLSLLPGQNLGKNKIHYLGM